MAVLQKAPAASSPINDADRYARLADSIRISVGGQSTVPPGKIAAAVMEFKPVADGFFDIRRFQSKVVWRAPLARATAMFVAAPSRSSAKEAAALLPASPYEDSYIYETAVFFLMRAALDVAANARTQANADAQLATAKAESAFSVFSHKPVDVRELLKDMPETHNDYFDFGYVTGARLLSALDTIGAPFLTRAQRPYLRSYGLLRVTAATIADLIARWPPDSKQRSARQTGRARTEARAR